MFQRLRSVSRQVARLRSTVLALSTVLNPVVEDTKIASASREVIAQWLSQASVMKIATVEFVSATKPAVSIMKTARQLHESPKYQKIYQNTFASLATQAQGIEVRVMKACIDVLKQSVELSKIRGTLPAEAVQGLTVVLLTGKDFCLELASSLFGVKAPVVESKGSGQSAAETECVSAVELLLESIRRSENLPPANEECTMYSEEELRTLESELQAVC